MICLGGWYPRCPKKGEKGKDSDSDTAELFIMFGQYLGDGYAYSIVRVDPKNLVITDDRRFVGSILNTEKVRGISDVSSKEPLFYVLEKNVEAIRAEISKVNKEVIIM